MRNPDSVVESFTKFLVSLCQKDEEYYKVKHDVEEFNRREFTVDLGDLTMRVKINAE